MTLNMVKIDAGCSDESVDEASTNSSGIAEISWNYTEAVALAFYAEVDMNATQKVISSARAHDLGALP